MKRISAWILLLAMMVVSLLANGVEVKAESEDTHTRVINLVYDDSGSMIFEDNKKQDTWCKAKYSLEVFAAMLGEQDTMNVYVMSDFASSSTGKPKLILRGSNGAEENVSKVHSMCTRALGTPFNSVRQAYKDLANVKADEKWLIVLTDGAFDNEGSKSVDVDAFMAKKASDISVMFLSMGAKAASIKEVEDKNIYSYTAKTNEAILNKITDMCGRVFDFDRITVDPGVKKLDIDVPMKELTVFAQGANVAINGIKRSDDSLVKSSTEPVNVQYSEKAATNYQDPIIDRALKGSLAVFKDDFGAGSYTLDVSGAETIEVYYKPNIEIIAYLENSEGQRLSSNEAIHSGVYKFKFGFVKAGTTEEVPMDSVLLGEVSFSAVINNNGNEQVISDHEDVSVTLEEGEVTIDASATYLDYHSVNTTRTFRVFKNKDLSYTTDSAPEYKVVEKGFESIPATSVKVVLDGKEITAEQWELMELPKASYAEKYAYKLGEPKIEKSETPGVFYVYPSMPKSGPNSTTYENCKVKLEFGQKVDDSYWSGDCEVELKITDDRNFWEKYKDDIIKGIIAGGITLLILGWTPLFKAYLPKKLKKKPTVECKPTNPAIRRTEDTGKLDKDLITTLIPFIPQTGSIRFVPSGTAGVNRLKVSGMRGNRMKIKNFADYKAKTNITFNGQTMAAHELKSATAGLTIVVRTPSTNYSCTLNQ